MSVNMVLAIIFVALMIIYAVLCGQSQTSRNLMTLPKGAERMIFLFMAAALAIACGVHNLCIRRHNSKGERAFKTECEKHLSEYNAYIARVHGGDSSFISLAEFCLMRKYAKEPKKISSDSAGWVFCVAACLILAILTLGILNASNYKDRVTAEGKTENYQQFVDNNTSQTLSVDGWNDILNWNNRILEARHNQDHWLLGSHYIFCDDWNKVPLVNFSTHLQKSTEGVR